MCNANLSDANWALIFAFLRTQSNLYIGSDKPVDGLWKPFCGYFAAVHSGDSCRKSEVIGIAFTNVLSDGVTKVSELVCTPTLPMILTWKVS